MQHETDQTDTPAADDVPNLAKYGLNDFSLDFSGVAKLETRLPTTQPATDAEPIRARIIREVLCHAVAVSGGQNYYVIEQDGERFAVPAGEAPAHERGDEITASHTNEGIETGAAYDYGR